jgi:hypothetical protein
VEALVSSIAALKVPSSAGVGIEAFRGLPAFDDGFGSAQALSRFLISDPEHAAIPVLSSLNRWSTILAEGSDPPETGFLLVVDQFEEAFAWPNEHLENFVQILAALADSPEHRILVLATVRSDSYADLQKCQPLIKICQRFSGCLVDILPPTPNELAEMVRRPATVVGLQFEADESGGSLDDRLLAEANDQTSVLPVLSFVLEKLYAQRRNGRLLFSAYDEMGGLAGALREKADAAVDRALSGERHPSEVFSRMVRPLVSLSANGQPMRRRAFEHEFRVGSAEQGGLAALVKERLVISFLDSVPNEPRYVLAHDILLTQWARLADWVSDNAVLLLVRERVERDAERWNEAGRPKELLAGEGPRLEDVRSLTQHGMVPASAVTYSALSLRQARRLTWLRRIAVSLTAAAAVALAVLSVSLYRSGSRDRIELAELSTGKAIEQLKGGSPNTAFEHFADALDANPEAVSLLAVRQAIGMLGAEASIPLQGPTPGEVEVSPGGKWIVGVVDDIPTVWDVRTGLKILADKRFVNPNYSSDFIEIAFCGEDLAYISEEFGDELRGVVIDAGKRRAIPLPPRSDAIFCGEQTNTVSVSALQFSGEGFEVMALDQRDMEWKRKIAFPPGVIPFGAFPVPGEETAWGYALQGESNESSSAEPQRVLVLARRGKPLQRIAAVKSIEFAQSEWIVRAGERYFLRTDSALVILDANLSVQAQDFCVGGGLGKMLLRTQKGGVVAECREGELQYFTTQGRPYSVALPHVELDSGEDGTKGTCCAQVSKHLFNFGPDFRLRAYSLEDAPVAFALRFAPGAVGHDLGPGVKNEPRTAGGLTSGEDGRIIDVDLDRMAINTHYPHVERFDGLNVSIHPQPEGAGFRLEMKLPLRGSLPWSTPCLLVSAAKTFELPDCEVMPSATGRRIASLSSGAGHKLRVVDLKSGSSTELDLKGFGEGVSLANHGLQLPNHWGLPRAVLNNFIFPIQGSDDFLVVVVFNDDEVSRSRYLRCTATACERQFELSDHGGFVIGAWSDGRVLIDEAGGIALYDKHGNQIRKTAVGWNFWGNGDPFPPASLIAPDGLVYIAYDNGLLAVVDSKTGQLVNSRSLSGAEPSLGLTAMGTLYYFDGESLAEYSVPELALLNTSRIEDPTFRAAAHIRISPLADSRFMRLESIDNLTPNGYVLWDSKRFDLAALASSTQEAGTNGSNSPHASLAALLHWLANCGDRDSNKECKGRDSRIAAAQIRKLEPKLVSALLPHLREKGGIDGK